MSHALTYNSFVVAELEANPSHVYGTGGPDYPRLMMNLRSNFLPYGLDQKIGDELLFFSIKAELFINDCPHRIADTFQPFQYQSVRSRQETSVVLDFPLDRYRVEKIEQRRSGDVKIKAVVNVASALNGVPRHGDFAASTQPRLHGFQNLFCEITFTIPHSVWLQNVLPGLGWGTVQVIELPSIGLEEFKRMEHAYTALKKGEELFKNGDYDQAVGFCRTAIDPVREDLKKLKLEKPNNLGADWAEKIGNSTVEWLTTVLGKTHGVANTPHHSPNPGHFTRLDAQMILTVTAAVLAYLGRTKN